MWKPEATEKWNRNNKSDTQVKYQEFYSKKGSAKIVRRVPILGQYSMYKKEKVKKKLPLN